MSNIKLPSSAQSAKIDTFTRVEGVDTVHMQAMVPVESSTGTPLNGLYPLTIANADALNEDLFSGDLSAWSTVYLQILGTFVGTITFQISNDNANWVSIPALNVEQAGYVTSATAPGVFVIPIHAMYVRARLTAYTSGTVQAVGFLSGTGAELNTASVTATLAVATALIGDVGLGIRTTTTNASLIFKIMSLATTNATVVKAAVGRLYGYTFSNTTASYKYVKIYNKSTAPVVGTDAPIDVIAIPPNDSVAYMNPFGVYHSVGISYAITELAPDSDATAVAVNDVIGKLIYA